MPERSELDDTFAAVPRWLAHRVTPPVLAVYVALAMRVTGMEGKCFPSIALIARDANVSDRTVQRALVRLRELGAVSWTPRGNELGDRWSNLYSVRFYRDDAEDHAFTQECLADEAGLLKIEG